MNITARIRQGKGPVWGTLKQIARALLAIHIPVNVLTRPLFRLLYGLHVGIREGIIWLGRFFWFEPLFRSQCVAVGRGLRMEFLPYLSGKGRIVLGDHVRLSGKPSISFSNRLRPDPELIIGDDTFIGHQCGFNVATSIRIGNHCLLATGVRIYDFDGHPYEADRRRANEPFPPENSRPVVIGDDVWIGSEVVILKGVTIGPRSIVAAASVVASDVPPDTIVGGNPARVLKRLAGEETLP